MHEPPVATSSAAVFLELPATGAGDAALLAAFGSYGGSHGSCSSGLSIGSVSPPASPTSPSSHCGLPVFVPVGIARHNSGIIAAQDVAGSVPGPGPPSLIPLISTCGNGLDLLVVTAGLVELKGVAIKTSGAPTCCDAISFD